MRTGVSIGIVEEGADLRRHSRRSKPRYEIMCSMCCSTQFVRLLDSLSFNSKVLSPMHLDDRAADAGCCCVIPYLGLHSLRATQYGG